MALGAGLGWAGATLWASPSRMDLLDHERVLEVGDRLVYQVVEEREPSIGVFVNDRGEVDLPLIGGMAARGQTPRDFAFAVKAALEETFFHQATVLVEFQFPTGSRGTVNLAGEINRPGTVPLPVDEILTLSEAILRAGGTRVGADLTNVTVARPDASGEPEPMTVDLTDVFERGDMRADLVLQPGDTIVIPRQELVQSTYTVRGLVNSPGVFDLVVNGEPIMLSAAIMRAGGFGRFAAGHRVVVIRGDTSLSEEEREVRVDVEAILDEGRRELDIALQPFDIVRVDEKIITWR